MAFNDRLVCVGLAKPKILSLGYRSLGVKCSVYSKHINKTTSTTKKYKWQNKNLSKHPQT